MEGLRLRVMGISKKGLTAMWRRVVALRNATTARKKKGALTMEHIPMVKGTFEWALSRMRKGCATRAIHWPEDFFMMVYNEGMPTQRPSIYLYNAKGCVEPWEPSTADILADFYEEFDLVQALEFRARSRLRVVSLKLGDIEIPIDKITEYSKR